MYRYTLSDDGIATISFYHPPKTRCRQACLNELADMITFAGIDSKSRVILLKSGGDRTFCAGASFDELLQIKDKQAGADFFGLCQCDKCLPKIA
jgi:methylglutaconyl-CoA hydratase